MQAQGTGFLNPNYFTSLTNRINAATSCAELQAATNDVIASLSAVKAGVNSELAVITPMLALLSPPAANPSAIVTWITSFINVFLTPITRPHVTMYEQLVGMSMDITALISAITAKQATFSGCSISIPTY